jgi:cytochrome P450
MGRTLQTLSGDEHRRSRALVAPPFAANKVRAYVVQSN